MIPAPDPALVPAGPYVLAENEADHLLVITTMKDWGDGKGLRPQVFAPLVAWKQRRSGPRGRPVWMGFRPDDVAIAHHLLSLLNRGGGYG
jgi:hypothetical protein